MKTIAFPQKVKRGSVTVKIYRTPSHGCDSFTLSYYQDGVRKRPTFPDFENAKAEAELIATRLASKDSYALALSSADCSAYSRARQVLDPLGVAIETAAVQFADARQRLGDVPLSYVVDFFLKRHPAKIVPKPVSVLVAEMMAAKQADSLSARYLQCLRYCLGKFEKAFQGNINAVSGADIDKWLRASGLSPRTRNNLRNSVQTLFGFAKTRGYLPKDHDEIDSVPTVKDREGAIEVFTPAEMAEILSNASERVIPFMALGGFAGIRHAEIQRLDWKDIRFDDGIVELHAAKAKTASRRTVPLLDNLRAWLLPYRQATGLVCSYKNMAFEIRQLTQRINSERKKRKVADKFAWKHNALRHSFISYRVAAIQNVAQVALEAGNSPQMIFRHYRELVRPADAKKWFSIAPQQPENVAVMPQTVAA